MTSDLVDPKRRVFLSAAWRHLVLLNYAVPDELLQPYLPTGCTVDRLDGKAYVSIVAFMFEDTRVFGVKWPGFTKFPELNLRFYVRYQEQRCVCFVREYVPSRLVAALARWLYNEPYKSAQMRGEIHAAPDHLRIKYMAEDGGKRFAVEMVADNKPYMPNLNSTEHFFKEHELGVGRDRRGRTLTYRVHHPHWRVYPVTNCEVNVDAGAMYGEAFAGLQTPDSVVLAEGSEIVVYAKD